MQINFTEITYTAIVIEEQPDGMIVKYSAEGYDDIEVGTPLKPDAVTEAEFFRSYAPVGLWREQHITRSAVPVGTAVQGSLVLSLPGQQVEPPPAPATPSLVLDPAPSV